MGKSLGVVIAVVAAVAIAVAAPYLAPIALGVISVTATATAVAIATTVIATTLSLGLALGMRALGIGAPSAIRGAVGPPSVFRQSIANSFIVYGQRRVGGLLVFFHSVQGSSGAHFRYFVIACAGHRCQGLVSWMLNDEVVTVDGSHKVTSGKYADNAWLWFQRGLATETANSTFVSECGGRWTTAHRGNGVAAIYAKFKLEDTALDAGMPNITAIIQGRDEITDTRTSTTGYTNNAALVFYDWLKMPREEGGFGAYADEIPDDTWISAQANVCDETVSSEPRYTLNGVITTGAPPGDVRDLMIVNCAGSYTFSGGKHLMRPGYWVPVTATLSEDDVAGAIQVSPFATADNAITEVQGSYISPGADYQATPFVTQALSPVPSDIRQADLDLAFTTSPKQAERVARIMLNRAQAEKTVVWPMNISGLKIRALDTIQLDSARYGLSNYAWSVRNWSLSPDWGVVLSLQEESESIYLPPVVITPATPPLIVKPTVPVLPSSEIATLILNSYVTDADPLDGLIQASATSITIETHTRTYTDKSVSVTGGTIMLEDDGATSIAASTKYHIYYDDALRAGGAVSYKATQVATTAATSSTYPYRHYVGSITTDVSGGTGTHTGGAYPGGWDLNDYR